METIVLPSVKPRLKHAFTKENAAAMSARANQVKRERKARERAELERLRAAERIPNQLADEVLEGRTRRLPIMSKTSDPDELNKLSAARDKLLTEWQVLTGTPNPGSRRVKATRPASAAVETVQVVSDNGTTGQRVEV